MEKQMETSASLLLTTAMTFGPLWLLTAFVYLSMNAAREAMVNHLLPSSSTAPFTIW